MNMHPHIDLAKHIIFPNFHRILISDRFSIVWLAYIHEYKYGSSTILLFLLAGDKKRMQRTRQHSAQIFFIRKHSVNRSRGTYRGICLMDSLVPSPLGARSPYFFFNTTHFSNLETCSTLKVSYHIIQPVMHLWVSSFSLSGIVRHIMRRVNVGALLRFTFPLTR